MASKIVIFFAILFDVAAFGLAIAAEKHRSKVKVVPDAEKNYLYCMYDSDIATGYGMGAFVLLMVSQAILMIPSKSFCWGRTLRPGGSRDCTVVLFLACWGTFLIAEASLLAGSVQNANHTRYRTVFFAADPPACQTLRKGVFAAGGAFVFLTAVLSLCYYAAFSKADTDMDRYGYGKESAIGTSPNS